MTTFDAPPPICLQGRGWRTGCTCWIRCCPCDTRCICCAPGACACACEKGGGEECGGNWSRSVDITAGIAAGITASITAGRFSAGTSSCAACPYESSTLLLIPPSSSTCRRLSCTSRCGGCASFDSFVVDVDPPLGNRDDPSSPHWMKSPSETRPSGPVGNLANVSRYAAGCINDCSGGYARRRATASPFSSNALITSILSTHPASNPVWSSLFLSMP